MKIVTKLGQIKIDGKAVCLRVDYNVPFKEDGSIADDSRITATLPTIKYLQEKGCGIVILSHRGRPKGRHNEALSLQPICDHLANLLQTKIAFHGMLEPVKKPAAGKIIMLENLRFWPGEEKPDNDPAFAKRLAAFGDAYVNDAFAVSHRKHTSVWSLPKLFPGAAAAGLLMVQELDELSRLTDNPVRPFYAVIGGSKVSTKLGVIESLLTRVDGLMIGGGLAYTFLKAQGLDVGSSLVEDDLLEKAQETLESAASKQIAIHLPNDLLVSSDIDARVPAKAVDITGIGRDSGVSIGPNTLDVWSKELDGAKTIFWNGPLGIYEMEPYRGPTIDFAHRLAEKKDALTIAGGGDCIAAIHAARVADRFSYLSTGGGATLELLEFGTLPGIEVLKN